MKDELKECPFCGNEVVVVEHEDSTPIRQRWIIECHSCGLSMFDLREKSLIESWNTRTTQQTIKDYKTRLCNALNKSRQKIITEQNHN